MRAELYLDNKDVPFDGAETYEVTLPPNIPAARFWSFTLGDNQSRSMLDSPLKSFFDKSWRAGEIEEVK